jgi:MFS-type transporter involved in bile tolerance (Atg22 family)
METLTIDSYIDFSFIVALFFAGQLEKKYDLFGKIIKKNTSDRWKVLFIGLIHSIVWIVWLRPEDVSVKDQVKIIFTSYLVTVVLYDYLLRKFLDKFSAKE